MTGALAASTCPLPATGYSAPGRHFGRRTTMTDADRLGNDAKNRLWAERMIAVQAGDRVAYEALLRDCVPVIAAVARRQRVRPALVDDVVQDVLMTLHRARQTYDPSRPFLAWLTTIAQRRAIDVLRRDGRRNAHEVDAPLAYDSAADPGADPAAGHALADEAQGLKAAVATLPAGQREAVERLAFEQLSLAEASAATGRTKTALKVNFHRALKTLRARFGVEDGSRDGS